MKVTFNQKKVIAKTRFKMGNRGIHLLSQRKKIEVLYFHKVLKYRH